MEESGSGESCKFLRSLVVCSQCISPLDLNMKDVIPLIDRTREH